jgi:FKBP-type peptidyl-prolyl cis-trans isomerase FkpA
MPHTPKKQLLAAALLAWAGATMAQAPAGTAPASTPGAVTTASGLVYRATAEGKGPSPTATDRVKVHYRGTFADGREFDSSYSRNAPAVFPLNRVIKCWTEGVQMMKVGGKARLTCPASIAYGEKGAGNGLIPPNTVLFFDVELLAIEKP